jgi:hypothetical protein
MTNRLQVFTPEGDLRLVIGGFGMLPGEFQALTGVTIDKLNRVFTSEQLLGRVQMFRYITNTEAQAEYDRRKAEVAKKAAQTPTDDKKPAAPITAPETPKPVPPTAAQAAPAAVKAQ